MNNEEGINPEDRRRIEEMAEAVVRHNMNREGQNNEEGGLIPDHRRIEDLESWLQNNGLRRGGHDDADAEQQQEEEPTADEVEDIQRFQEQSQYQQTVHDRIFSQEEKCEEEEKALEERKKKIDSWKSVRMDVFTADGVIADVPLQPLAAECDTVFALASSWRHFAASCSDSKKLHLSLESYPETSVRDFLRVLTEEVSVEDISGASIVDCCQIAHYLQNSAVLDATVDILLQSIDTSNCLSLSQLADQLNLPTLFERSLSHMMDTIGDLEDTDAYNDLLTTELQERITAIKTAIHSSIHSQGSRLYFSSLEEYIAIFAERVQYYRERLAEAREQQAREQPYTGSWWYAQEKIERQETRVRTLEIALEEQKKLFSGK